MSSMNTRVLLLHVVSGMALSRFLEEVNLISFVPTGRSSVTVDQGVMVETMATLKLNVVGSPMDLQITVRGAEVELRTETVKGP